MKTIQRAKNILMTPKTEWELISEENNGHVKLLTGYLIPLALIPAIAGSCICDPVGHIGRRDHFFNENIYLLII